MSLPAKLHNPDDPTEAEGSMGAPTRSDDASKERAPSEISRVGLASILITLLGATAVLVLLAMLPPVPHTCAAQDLYSQRWSGRVGWLGLLFPVTFLLSVASLFVRRRRRVALGVLGMVLALLGTGLWLFAELEVLGAACGVM